MKITLYLATSLNGSIAKGDDDTDWISQDEWNSWSDRVKNVKHIVLGKTTYDLMVDGGDIFSECLYYLITSTAEHIETPENIFAVQPDVHSILRLLQDNDVEDVLVIGGAQANSLFLSSGLVDEIILDIEPIIFAGGINLVTDEVAEDVRLSLEKIDLLTDDLIQVTYTVEK